MAPRNTIETGMVLLIGALIAMSAVYASHIVRRGPVEINSFQAQAVRL